MLSKRSLSPSVEEMSEFDELLLALEDDSNCTEESGSLFSTHSTCEIMTIKRQKIEVPLIEGLTAVLRRYKNLTRLYSPVRTDYRRMYNTIMFEAANSGNMSALSHIVNHIINTDCCSVHSDIVTAGGNYCLGSVTHSRSKQPHQLLTALQSLFQSMPDTLFYPYKHNLVKLVHVPDSFAKIPLKYLYNVDHLNAYLSQQANKQCVTMRPGYANIGKCVISGTKVLPQQPSQERYLSKIPTGGYDSEPDNFDSEIVRYEYTFIHVLDEYHKIIRMESFVLKNAEPGFSLLDL